MISMKNLVFIAESEYQLNTQLKKKIRKAKFLFSIEHNTETNELEKVA
jgi:hypothetical protein